MVSRGVSFFFLFLTATCHRLLDGQLTCPICLSCGVMPKRAGVIPLSFVIRGRLYMFVEFLLWGCYSRLKIGVCYRVCRGGTAFDRHTLG